MNAHKETDPGTKRDFLNGNTSVKIWDCVCLPQFPGEKIES